MTSIPVSRRNILKWAAAAAGTGLAGPLVVTRLSGLGHAAKSTTPMGMGELAGPGMTGGSPVGGSAGAGTSSSGPFSVPLELPEVLAPTATDSTTDYYTLTARAAQKEILPGLQTTIWGYDGRFPGPTIVARRGRKVVLRQVNQLEVPITTHLHGGHVAPSSDGYPTDLIQPGGSRTYTYANQQRTSTLWYHDHRMGATGKQVWMGLAGLYLIQDETEATLGLPSGAYDIPLVIQDRSFASDGSFVYPSAMGMMSGAQGDTILVNGRPQPYLQVAARKYRFRILNGSNARAYELALADGRSLVQIATDGGLLPGPVARDSLPIAPAERYEVVIDFSAYPVGSQVVLENRAGSGSTASVMRFDVVRHESDPSTVPSSLRPMTALDPSTAAATRDFAFGMGGGQWVINGNTFDPARIDARPRLGTTEIWTFRSDAMGMAMFHPVHMHDVTFQVLDRNGAPPAPGEAGWKDTVVVNAGDVVRVIARFEDYRGRYVFHCHILEHEDLGMMAQFEVG